jgi:hypothetical protein
MAHSQEEAQSEYRDEADGKTLSNSGSQKLTHDGFSRASTAVAIRGYCDSRALTPQIALLQLPEVP